MADVRIPISSMTCPRNLIEDYLVKFDNELLHLFSDSTIKSCSLNNYIFSNFEVRVYDSIVHLLFLFSDISGC